MDSFSEYLRWVSYEGLDKAITAELSDIADKKEEIHDRFYRHLTFGTGGLRGVIGAGTNRMNIYTVGKATKGLANYLLARYDRPLVCIAYDTRNLSHEFAYMAAQVLCASGVAVCMFDSVRPTPMLSYAVRYHNANAGVMITASHNPKEYNGYKVYGSDGGQITDEAAAEIFSCIESCDLFDDVKTISISEAMDRDLLTDIREDIDTSYYDCVKNLLFRKDLIQSAGDEIKILYTPLHGTGNIPVRRVLRELGFSRVDVIPEQEYPDGNFSTVRTPNPEEPEVFSLAIKKASNCDYDLICATDPDCDRIGVLVKDESGEFSLLSGNQMGLLLCDYLIQTMKDTASLPNNAAVIKTIVTTELAQLICKAHDVTVINTLTGFKYIGEKIGEWERSGEYSFLFGFEESFGYLAGTFVRDKDAVIAAALIAEMTLYYKKKGVSLLHALQELYQRYGYSSEKLLSITMPGDDGHKKIQATIERLRNDTSGIPEFDNLAFIEDYWRSTRSDCRNGTIQKIDLPKSNVLKFVYRDGSGLTIRPSGTEPKVKLYLSAIGKNCDFTLQRLEKLESMAKQLIETDNIYFL